MRGYCALLCDFASALLSHFSLHEGHECDERAIMGGRLCLGSRVSVLTRWEARGGGGGADMEVDVG